MKNIAKAVSLVLICLLGILPTIQAQNTDTKAAPDLPNFKVTLGVKSNAGGTFEASVANRKLTYSSTKDTCQIVYGEAPTIKLTANPQYMLESFTVNGTDKTLDATFTEGKPVVNTYYWTSSALTAKTDIAIIWKEKPSVKVTVTGTEQIVNDKTAATVTVTADGATLSNLKYYKTAAATGAEATETERKAAGTFYIPIKIAETVDKKAVDMVITMVVNNKSESIVGTPSCNATLLQGQPLSAAAINPGTEANLTKGTWSWANPNQAVTAGEATSNTYDAIFTPDLASLYASVRKPIGVKVLTVTTVTVQQTDGGVVAIKGATADNKYIGTTGAVATIAATATPKAGYKFVKWVNPSDETSTGSETAVTKSPITAIDGLVISAEFAKATRTVTIGSVTNGTLKVMNGASEVAIGTAVPVGTTLTIVATPNEGYQVQKVGYTTDNNNTLPATSFVVGGTSTTQYAVSAAFGAKPIDKFMVTVAEAANGSLTLKDATGSTVNSNSAVASGTALSVIALPNKGYKLNTLTANNTNIATSQSTTVTAATTITATFTELEYQVTVSTPAEATITGAKTGLQKFATVLQNVTAAVRDADNYRLMSLLVDNLPVENGSNITVDGVKNISADVKKLTEVKILNEETTTVTYNSTPQEYAIKTANGLGGFKIMYGESATAPTNKGTYTLTITRPADDVYAKFTTTRTMIINPAVPAILQVPLADAVKNEAVTGSSTVAGKWSTSPDRTTRSMNSLRAEGDLVTVYFIPDDPNMEVLKLTTPKNQATAETLTATITMPKNVTGGRLELLNETAPLASGATLYKGVEIKINAIADAGYTVASNRILVDGVAKTSFTLSGNVEVTIATDGAFTAKEKLTVPGSKAISKVYTGSPIEVTASALGLPAGNWAITYKKGGNITTPENIGEYTIEVSCAEGANNQAVAATTAGTLTIKQAAAKDMTITLPSATPVMTGADLSTSALNGGMVKVGERIVQGSFAWKTIPTKVEVAGDNEVTFTPVDLSNYATATGKVYVSLKEVTSHKMTLTPATNVKVTDANGLEVANGALVPDGMQLTVKATKGTIVSVAVNPEAKVTPSSDGSVWTFLTPKADFTVTVTFTKPVTSITLDKTKLAMNINGEATLKATIEPTDADVQTVTWKSSNPSIATVTEGKVKALKVGSCTIIATAGEKTATCEVTVTAVTPPTPDPDPTPTVIAVKGISVDAATKALVVKTGFTLKAAINPTNADNQKVTWTNSNPMVASATGTGLELKVTALKAGTTTFTVTTDEGKFTATCVVTVTAATGLEEFGTTRVYPLGGAICVDPAMPLEVSVVSMAGAMVYRDQLTTVYQIPVASGVYLVHLSDGKNQGTMKVIVK